MVVSAVSRASALHGPSCELAVNAGIGTRPDASLVPVAVLVPVPVKMPDGPLPGRTNVMDASGNAASYWSVTFTTGVTDGPAPCSTVWLSPVVSSMPSATGEPLGVLLVSVKLVSAPKPQQRMVTFPATPLARGL